MTSDQQEEIKKHSALKKGYQTEQNEGSAIGFQKAYDSNPEQVTDAYNMLQNYNNITIKPGT